MDKQFYIAECNKQMSDTTFYIKQDKDTTNKVTKTVTNFLQLMKNNKNIDEETFTYMSPKQPTCSRFYILPKIHKDRNNPPGRQLVSKLPSYIKDNTHFLNKLCSISAIPNDSLLVTLDASSFYTNIPHTEGIKAARIHLNKRTLKTPPTETVCDLIDIILTNNNFEFSRQHFLQKQGTAMGTRMAPPYANLFMGTFESDALEKAPYKPLVSSVAFHRRYIYDVDTRTRQTH